MKNLYLILCASFIILFSACDKDGGVDTKDLTQCPANTNCDYYFKTAASVRMQDSKPAAGDSIVFVYEKKSQGMASHIFIRAHKNASSFRLTKSEISSGHVRNYFNCPLCDYILLNPVDGFVEGKKLNSSKWLIDAQIILATRLYSKITDTVKVRQIFIRKNSN